MYTFSAVTNIIYRTTTQGIVYTTSSFNLELGQECMENQDRYVFNRVYKCVVIIERYWNIHDYRSFKIHIFYK